MAQHDKLDEASAVYHRRLRACEAAISEFDRGKYNMQVIDDRTALHDKLSGLAFALLLKGEFGKALDAIDAVPSSPLPATLDIRRAHALLLLGHSEKAKAVYFLYRGTKVNADQRAEEFVATDFAALRDTGHAHPLMNECEHLLTHRQGGPSLVR